MNPASRRSLFDRGAWYVVVQALLIGLILFGPQGFLLVRAEPLKTIFQSSGISIGLLACLIVVISAINLGKNLTPLPCPRDDAQLVQAGLYGFVRHPMYFGVLLAAVAWFLLLPGMFILAYVICLFLLFDLKARREEVWLVERFPEYGEYQVNVKKLIPGIY
ncbi:isoprenylcysteine carboxylmethyltransferase family protein [Polynucleobacter sp. CS-Odin-A6]|uniref:methyltransferase family protein n=1 Tax=Polynucleobacter sp. CS-Odin-A6 TaxID=2689106 RepID=UPI001C0C9EEE|nr:isoprenylcysteine carboxylmethyltransferase family protein [Polynucleobacter sp. CS-Odin-A6]MBU3620687.1 isoprenylcysteine carboxylmethyltransferase family protein [Polynucleobacter sp. CS-Odin-A6]